MNNLSINTNELGQKIIKINALLGDLDAVLDKFDTKIKSISYANSIWYSSTTIELYNHYLEKVSKIKNLQNSYKRYLNSINNIIDEYENLEKELIEKYDNISSIKIV